MKHSILSEKMFVIPIIKNFRETSVFELIEGQNGFIIEIADIFSVKVECFIIYFLHTQHEVNLLQIRFVF